MRYLFLFATYPEASGNYRTKFISQFTIHLINLTFFPGKVNNIPSEYDAYALDLRNEMVLLSFIDLRKFSPDSWIYGILQKEAGKLPFGSREFLDESGALPKIEKIKGIAGKIKNKLGVLR